MKSSQMYAIVFISISLIACVACTSPSVKNTSSSSVTTSIDKKNSNKLEQAADQKNIPNTFKETIHADGSVSIDTSKLIYK